MTTNKIIAEKINVFLNLLFHLEDYITNQQIREEQLHISNNVKIVLSEVAESPKVKEYFYKGADINHEYEDNQIEPEFKLMKLTKDKIKYIKKANPQSFNQKNLQLLNYFYNSSGEADMIYDSIKMKMLSIIKFCLTQIMLKKLKEREKEIYSKINFVLISKNNKLLVTKNNFFNNNNKYSLIKKNKSVIDMKEKFKTRPNFIIPPPINLGKNNYKNKFLNNKTYFKKDNINYNIEEYNKINISKNYKLVQQNLKDKNKDNLPNKITKYKNKIQISPSSQLNLIDILHGKKKKLKFNKFNKIRKEVNKEVNNISYNNNFYRSIINKDENNKLPDPLIKKRNQSENKVVNKNYENKGDKNININSNDYDYKKIFGMFDALKNRGYIS